MSGAVVIAGVGSRASRAPTHLSDRSSWSAPRTTFTSPLLAEVAGGSVSPSHVANAIRAPAPSGTPVGAIATPAVVADDAPFVDAAATLPGGTATHLVVAPRGDERVPIGLLSLFDVQRTVDERLDAWGHTASAGELPHDLELAAAATGT